MTVTVKDKTPLVVPAARSPAGPRRRRV